MHVLVIGGTLFLGRAIVAELLAGGHRVTLFTRGLQRPTFAGPVESVTGDRATDLGRLRGRTFDAVIDNIAFTGEHVADALAELRSATGRYLLTSSAAVYHAFDGEPPVTEADVDHRVTRTPETLRGFRVPYPPEWPPYAVGKVAAERRLLEEDRVPWTIVRPSIVVGADDPHETGAFWFRRLADGMPLVAWGGGPQRIQVGYVVDLARAIVRAIERPCAAGRIYNLAQAAPTPLCDWLARASRAIGHDAPVLAVDPERARSADARDAEPWTFTGDFWMDVTRACDDLDLESTPLERWMPETIAGYRDRRLPRETREREIALAHPA